MPNNLELTVEDILLAEQGFSEMTALMGLAPSAIPVMLNGLMTGVSRFVHENGQQQMTEDAVVAVENHVESQGVGKKLYSIGQHEKERFASVYETHKSAIKRQWEMVVEKDMKDLILENEISDFDVISHTIRQRVARGEVPEEQMPKLMGTLALVDSMRLGARTAVAGSLSSVAEYSEALGYCVAEQMHNMTPDGALATYKFFAELQKWQFREKVWVDSQTKGVRAFGDIPLDIDRHASDVVRGDQSVLGALASVPFSLMSYISAGAYEGVYSAGQSREQVNQTTTKPASPMTREEISAKIKAARKRREEEKMRMRAERDYENSNIAGKLLVNLRGAMDTMYTKVHGGVAQLRGEWDTSYAVASAAYDKADKKVERGMSSLLASIPYKSSSSGQMELAARQRVREQERQKLKEDLQYLRNQHSEENVHHIAALEKVLELDDLRKKTDKTSQQRVTELEKELKDNPYVISTGMTGYDTIRATLVASSLFTKAQTYAASRALARGAIETSGAVISAVASGVSSMFQENTSVPQPVQKDEGQKHDGLVTSLLGKSKRSSTPPVSPPSSPTVRSPRAKKPKLRKE